MNRIKQVAGDASAPPIAGPKIIAHVVNNQGAWGAGFTRSLTNNWPESGIDYRLWHRYRTRLTGSQAFTLGNVRNTLVLDDATKEGDRQDPVWVSHMMAQEGLPGVDNPRPLRYDVLGMCLFELSKWAKITQASVHMPRIGCGLAGGNWVIVEQLVNDALVRQGIKTYVYDLVA